MSWLNSLNFKCPLFDNCPENFIIYNVHCWKLHHFISCVQFNIHTETSTGIKSCITPHNTCGFQSSSPAILTFAEQIWPSFPGNSSSTFPSFQNVLFFRSDFSITVTYWDCALLVLHLSLARSRRLKRYSCCLLFVNSWGSCWWYLALFVKVWLTLTTLKCWLLCAIVIRLPVIRWNGVSGMEVDSSSS